MLLCILMFMLQAYQSYAAYASHDFVQTMSDVRPDKIKFPILALCAIKHSKHFPGPFNLKPTGPPEVPENSMDQPKDHLGAFREGVSYPSQAFVGWTEHPTEYVRSKATMANMADYAITAWLKEDLLKDLHGGDGRRLELEPLRTNYEFGLCYTPVLDGVLKELYEGKDISYTKPLILYIQHNASKGLDVHFLDSNKNSGYIFKGHTVGLGKPQYQTKFNFLVFDMTLRQRELNSKDPNVACNDYTAWSVAEEAEKTAMQEFSFLGCLPPWFTNRDERICKPSTPNITQNFRSNINKFLFHLRGCNTK
jgi:hypothetical protein